VALLILAKPGIVMAELAATLAGMLLSSPTFPSTDLLLWVFISVTLAGGGAAMSNGLIDAESDRLMPRLAARCNALNLAGEKLVLAVAIVSIVTSLVLAAFILNVLTALLLGTTIFTYLFLYTAWQKRISPFAVLVGGIPGAMPPLIGAAAAGSFTAAPALLSLVIYLWQLPHFLFLALEYQEQYSQAGVPVFPIIHGENLTKLLILASTALLIPATLFFRLFGSVSQPCSMTLLIASVTLLACSAWAIKLSTRYRHGFFASLLYLAFVLAVLISNATLYSP
jgi:protoheme IX farnesyltransferase